MRRIKTLSSPMPRHISILERDYRLMRAVVRAAEQLNLQAFWEPTALEQRLIEALDAFNAKRKQP